jgi:hypothetical protein
MGDSYPDLILLSNGDEIYKYCGKFAIGRGFF